MVRSSAAQHYLRNKDLFDVGVVKANVPEGLSADWIQGGGRKIPAPPLLRQERPKVARRDPASVRHIAIVQKGSS